MLPAATTALPARLRWADVAKGACILLVVLHHTVTKHVVEVVPPSFELVGQAWAGLSHALKPVRMPLFFVISGVFASRAVSRPWSASVRRRITSPAYLYVVWLLLLGAFFSVEHDLPMNRTQDLGELALDLVFASTGLWFLYALAVYFVLARLTVRVPTPWLLGVAAAVAASASLLPIEEANRVSVIVHFVHFAVGVRCPELLRRLAEDRRPLTAPLTLAFVVGAVLLGWAGAPLSVEITLLSLVGVPCGIRLAAATRRTPRLAEGLAWVGRRTLPVYVLHVPLLAVVHHVAPDLLPGAGTGALALAVAWPLLVTAVVVAGCLLVRGIAVRLGLRALFELPRRPVPAAPAPELERVIVSG